MSQVIIEGDAEEVEPIGQVRIVYLGPVEPHWDLQGVWGERVNRDGEREHLLVEWDLGFPEETAEPAAAETPATDA